MKKTVFFVLISLFAAFTVNLAIAAAAPVAGWRAAFIQTFKKEGLLIASTDALAKGVPTADLTKAALKLTNINPFNVIKVIVIAGGQSDIVLKAAIESGVSSIITLAAIAEGHEIRSGKKVPQTITIEPPAPAPDLTVSAGLPGGASGGGYISPSTL